MLHLLVETKNSAENLGLLIPAGDSLELRKQFPIKKIGEGSPAFFLQARQNQMAEFLAVCPEHPFPWLHRLDECVFAVRNGQTGVEIQAKKYGKKVVI